MARRATRRRSLRDYVRAAVAYVCERLPRPIRWFITINEPNMLVLNSYLGRQFPGRSAAAVSRR